MSTHVQSALQYRFTMPVWLLAVVLAAVLAIAALLAGSGSPRAPATAAPAAATTPYAHGSCLDSRVVGHC
jgi:hypothetical protein